MNIQRIPIQNRDQWLSLRAEDITASDIGAVCGEGMYSSAAAVYAEKKGLLGAREQTEAMKKGVWGEAAVFEAIGWERPDWELVRAKVYLRDPKARLGATPDGAALIPGRDGLAIVQAKVVSKTVFSRIWLDNPEDDPHNEFAPATVPLGYQLQVLTEAHLADAPWPIIAALVTDEWRWSLRLFDVPRNAAAEQKIRALVAYFWEAHLDPGIAPSIDPARDADLVKLLYPADVGTTIDLSRDNAMPGLITRLEEIKASMNNLTRERKGIETEIKGKMGPHSCATLSDGRYVTWKLQERAASYSEATSYRVLRTHKAVGHHLRRSS